jgi:hypothetical protein
MNQPKSSPTQWPGWSPWMFIFFAILCLLLGAGFIVQSLVDRNLNARFDGPVVHVRGVVDDVIQIERTGSSKSNHSTHRVDYHFDAPDGRHKTGADATTATCNSLHPDDSVPVKYLPGNPSTSRLDLPQEDASHRQEVWIDLASGIVLVPLGAFFFLKWRRS